jgi:hypothetical protein
MKLEAVFWDYPQFLDENYLSEFMQQHKNTEIYFWLMYRFLEHARVVDTFHFFKIQEIAANINKLKLTDYARKKWNRMIEVYGDHPGK